MPVQKKKTTKTPHSRGGMVAGLSTHEVPGLTAAKKMIFIGKAANKPGPFVS
jgi:hypothetical protein